MKRLLFVTLIGLFITAGASASVIVETDCTQCGGTGMLSCGQCQRMVMCPQCGKMVSPWVVQGDPGCPRCGGSGVIVKSTGFFVNYFEVECGCRGKNPECPICEGKGSYPGHTTGICEACQGEGGKPCPHCSGRGKLKANEKILKVLGLK